ncbi:hypothetical protein [Pollutimonas bauzanensis]|uniref:Riboflavin biosynthesis protein RibA n=1 Tax=Pollutimonas bauzanensis TaxID=658167 RepID=A0A1M5NE00_9BURK|nr:hypothetical protein [Pollutimonas bauzanensis]SHG87419.1 hypothetical protein SAMN04488135_101487 [Pollutimonas bauzanensis]
MAWHKLFGERATTKIAAVFDSEAAAEEAAASVRSQAGLQATQVLLVQPHEKEYARKLEPEPQGVARTALRSHMILGLAGLVAGAIVWMALYVADLPAILSSPGVSALFVLFLGAIAGLLLGGLITARPDHQLVIQRVQTATEEGRWSLVVHPRDARQCDAVMAALAASGADVARSV